MNYVPEFYGKVDLLAENANRKIVSFSPESIQWVPIQFSAISTDLLAFASVTDYEQDWEDLTSFDPITAKAMSFETWKQNKIEKSRFKYGIRFSIERSQSYYSKLTFSY